MQDPTRPGQPTIGMVSLGCPKALVDSERILTRLRAEGYAISRGSAAMDIWSRWQEGHLSSIEGEIHWNDLTLDGVVPGQEQNPRQLQLRKLGGHFRWQRTADGWRLGIADLDINRNGRGWPSSNLEVEGHFDQEGFLHLRTGVGFLRVEDVIALGRMFPLPTEELDLALAAMQPQADIYDLQFRFDDTPEGPQWTGRGRFEKLAILPWKSAPGISNLDAGFWLTHDRGALDLRGKEVSAHFPKLFRDPLQLQELNGLLSWERHPQLGWIIQSEELQADNSDIKTRSRLRMELPLTAEDSPVLDLQTDFRDGVVSTTSRYLPVGIMSDGVVNWLDRSLVSGHLVNGSCVFRGPVRDFPFEKRPTGRFEVLFGVEDLLLDYWPEWPRSEEITAEIRFLNNRFDAWIETGKILESTLLDVHGRIEHLSKATPFRLSGRVTGPLHDKLRLLGESPLRERFAQLSETIRTEGEGDLELDFAIPISTRRSDPFSLSGALTFKNSTIHVDEWQLPITQIKGKLLFNLNGVNAKGLEGQLLGSRTKIDVSPIKGKSGFTRITAYATLPVETLVARHLPELNLDKLKGTTDWKLQLDIPPLARGKKPGVGLRLSSSLRGVPLDLPAPIGKARQENRKLEISTRLSKQPRQLLGIRYGDLLDAALLLDRDDAGKVRLRRGGLQFGGAKAQLPDDDQILIGGQLDTLHLDPWLSSMESSGSALELPKISTRGLLVKQLRYGDTHLRDATFNLLSDQTGVTGQIEADRLAGSFHVPIPLKERPVTMRFDRLSLDFNPEQIAEIPQQDTETDWTDPRTLPAIDLQSENVTLNGRDYGQLTLLTRRTPEGVALDVISLISERLKFSARGEWIVHRGNAQTAIELTMDAESLGKLLDHLGYAPNLRRAPAKVEADLRWSGNPRQFSNTDLHGELKMDVGEGRFREVDPGLGRVFGLLNLSALQRRLSLDFSDLFKKGFSFDRMQGTFTLDEGDAYTNDLRIQGPAANIKITGRIGLVDQDFDQMVTVTPKISASLPIAGAVAGGPAVGAAVYLAQKVLGKRVDRVTNILYTVKGPWENPTITREKQKLESRISTLLELEQNPADASEPSAIEEKEQELSPWENPFLTPNQLSPE
jgi:uncharacterized protein (TIGR02099 family)